MKIPAITLEEIPAAEYLRPSQGWINHLRWEDPRYIPSRHKGQVLNIFSFAIPRDTFVLLDHLPNGESVIVAADIGPAPALRIPQT